jgi:phosphoribosylaminoimidazolecarboxamide formyltransferase/IMP cyclohydrolase
VQALGQHACVVIKHCNPCGAAQGTSACDALQRALASDPTSAFGGIVAFNTPLDDEAAAVLAERFLEVVVAPDVSAAALQRLASKPALRVMTPTSSDVHDYELRAISGGWLAQQPDDHSTESDTWQCVTQRQPDAREMADLQFAWAVVRSVRSNAIVYARDGATLGIGAGQMSRVDAARFGAMKASDAGHDLAGAVLASDAFFPFADGVEAAIAAGVRAVIQPGGSKRDDEVIAACDQHGVAMLMTGYRHFRH